MSTGHIGKTVFTAETDPTKVAETAQAINRITRTRTWLRSAS
jgi:hypothetical protein